jgi:Fe-S-cluster containining protein
MKNKYKKLEAIYKKIPTIDCKGLCHGGCTIIVASKIERKRARARLHTDVFKDPKDVKKIISNIDTGNIPDCKALKDKKCTIYNMRPAICRFYGVVEGMTCYFGCKPERLLTDREAGAILAEIDLL